MTDFRKAYPVTDAAFRNHWKAQQEQRCQCCGITRNGMWMSLERAEFHSHHIIRGAGRSDEACNLLLLCYRHHICSAHNYGGGENLTQANLLWLKKQTDEWDENRLLELAYRKGWANEPEKPSWLERSE